jgi:triacylglycerol esterase/lipase EstA (alpha/beta hydrolase family)
MRTWPSLAELALAVASLLLMTSAGCVEPPLVPGQGPPDAPGPVAEPPTVWRGEASPRAVVPVEEVLGRCGDQPLSESILEEGEAFLPDGRATGRMDECAALLFRGVASRGMVLQARLALRDPRATAELQRFDARGLHNGAFEPAERVTTRDGVAEIIWEVERTGELGLAVGGGTPVSLAAGARDFWLDVTCKVGCDASMTRYPIVLLHGMGGTDSFLGLFEYYLGVAGAMTAAGFEVYATVVDPLASSDVRAAQLAPQLERILAETGAARLNLIGHSQGGIDGRALIVQQGFGDRIASLTTLSTPHAGVPLADVLAGLVDSSSIGQALLDEVGGIYGQILGRSADQSFSSALREVGERYILAEFNPRHPDDPRVAYFSWAGRTCALTELACRDELRGELVNPLLAPSYRALQLVGVAQSDGLVGVESARWGEFLGVLPADHLAEVGLRVDSPRERWDHLEFFVNEGERLFAAGF